MATISLWPIKGASHLQRGIAYIMKPQKTMDGKLVSGENVLIETPVAAFNEFLEVKAFFNKLDERQGYHMEQSFVAGEVDPFIAHEIGERFAQKILPGFQVVVCTHVDTDHIHNHFIWNSVNAQDGHKYHEPNSLYEEYQKISDGLCREYGLSVVENPKSRPKARSFDTAKPEEANRRTARSYIYEDIDTAIQSARSLEEFWSILEFEMGYKVKRFGKSGEPLVHPSICPPSSETGHHYRLSKFTPGYTLEDIERRISERLAALDNDEQEDPRPFPARPVPGTPESAAAPEAPAFPEDQPAPAWFRDGRATREQYLASRSRYAQYFARRNDWTGLRSDFIQYRHVIVAVQRKSFPRYPLPQLRVGSRRLRQLNEESLLLIRGGYDTIEELAAHRDEYQQQISGLYREINRIKSTLRRSRKVPFTEDEREELNQKLDELKEQVRPLVHEKKLCDDIISRSEEVARQIEYERDEAAAVLDESSIWFDEQEEYD